MLPFIKEGLDFGEKSFHVVDPAAGEQSNQLEPHSWRGLRDRYFGQDKMLALVQAIMGAGQQQGIPTDPLNCPCRMDGGSMAGFG